MEFYVNRDTHEIFNEQKYNEIIANEVNSLRKNPSDFGKYLSGLWHIEEVFYFTDEEKDNALNNYDNILKEKAIWTSNVEKVTCEFMIGDVTMEIYIDWDNCEVLNKRKYDEIISNQIKKLKNRSKIFEDYLSRYYRFEDVFNFTNEDKDAVLEKYEKYLEELACENLNVEKFSLDGLV